MNIKMSLYTKKDKSTGEILNVGWVNVIIGEYKLEPEDIDDVIESYDIFMINRIFHSCDQLSPLVEMLNKKGYTKKMHFLIMRNAYLKKFGKKIIYIPFPKDNEKNEKINLIMDYYDVTRKIALQYFDIISDEELKDIEQYFEDIKKYSNDNIKKQKLSKKDMEEIKKVPKSDFFDDIFK